MIDTAQLPPAKGILTLYLIGLVLVCAACRPDEAPAATMTVVPAEGLATPTLAAAILYPDQTPPPTPVIATLSPAEAQATALVLTSQAAATQTAAPTPIPPTIPPLLPTAASVNNLSTSDIIVMPPNVQDNTRAIYAKGREMDRNPRAFSRLGDSIIEPPHFLYRFDEGPYNLGDYAYLQAVIDYYAGSFAHPNISVQRGLHSWSAFDPLWANNEQCLTNEGPLACEFRLHNPSLLFVRLGSNDVRLPSEFDFNLREIVQFCVDQGVVPILATKADRQEGSDENNEIIRAVAAEFAVPLWEFDRVAATLPGRGLIEDDVHMTFFYEYDYTSPDAFQSGHGMHNLTALMMLDAVWKAVLELN